MLQFNIDKRNQGCTNCGSLAVRKWRENEKMKMKWREIHSLHFIIFSLFPPSKIVTFGCKMLNTALFSQKSQKLTYAL